MTIFDEPKIDCHVHVLDPDRFPYSQGVAYRPQGQEIGSADQLVAVMDSFSTRHALLVQPNSGYGTDNSCMLDAIRRYPGRFLGVAIAGSDASIGELRELKDQGIVGVAFNSTAYGVDHYRDIGPLLERMAELDLFFNLQCEGEQLVHFLPWIREIPIRVLIDHCGRPLLGEGTAQPGFRELLDSAETGRVHVKLSGYDKFTRQPFPHADCHIYVAALLAAFTIDHCLWASDWPYLRARTRQEYVLLMRLTEKLFPDRATRAKLFWDNPTRLFGFGS